MNDFDFKQQEQTESTSETIDRTNIREKLNALKQEQMDAVRAEEEAEKKFQIQQDVGIGEIFKNNEKNIENIISNHDQQTSEESTFKGVVYDCLSSIGIDIYTINMNRYVKKIEKNNNKLKYKVENLQDLLVSERKGNEGFIVKKEKDLILAEKYANTLASTVAMKEGYDVAVKDLTTDLKKINDKACENPNKDYSVDRESLQYEISKIKKESRGLDFDMNETITKLNDLNQDIVSHDQIIKTYELLHDKCKKGYQAARGQLKCVKIYTKNNNNLFGKKGVLSTAEVVAGVNEDTAKLAALNEVCSNTMEEVYEHLERMDDPVYNTANVALDNRHNTMTQNLVSEAEVLIKKYATVSRK